MNKRCITEDECVSFNIGRDPDNPRRNKWYIGTFLTNHVQNAAKNVIFLFYLGKKTFKFCAATVLQSFYSVKTTDISTEYI